MEELEKNELDQRIQLLRNYMKEGKIRFPRELKDDIWPSLSKVKTGADGKVIPETVDSLVRSLCLAIAYFEYRDNIIQTTSIRDIQEKYFEGIQANFGFLYEEMIKRKLDPREMTIFLAREPKNIDYITSIMPKFFNSIVGFWNSAHEPMKIHLESLHTSKALFGGDAFPSYTKNIASTCGLYIDTIVLPDPFLRMKTYLEYAKKHIQFFYLVKGALNLLSYRQLALADVWPPIITIYPSNFGLEKIHYNLIDATIQKDTIAHCSKIFGREFSSFETLEKYMAKFTDANDVLGEAKNLEYILFQTEWTGNKKEHLERFIQEELPQFAMQPGLALMGQIYGRMAQADSVARESALLGGTPLIEAPTSWQYFNWKLKYEAISWGTDEKSKSILHVVRGLQNASDGEMSWLGNIPTEKLIELRRSGVEKEIRDIFSQSINEIISLDPTDFTKTTERVIFNVKEAFEVHRNKLDQIKKKQLKLFGIDLPSWLAYGSLAISAAVILNPALGIATALGGSIGVPNLKDICNDYYKIKEEKKENLSSPIGLLFQCSQSHG